MFSLIYLSLPAEVNARFIENGAGPLSWTSAAIGWSSVKANLESQLSELSHLTRRTQDVMDSSSGEATQNKLTELRTEIVALKSVADQMEKGSQEVASAYEAAKNSIHTVDEIEAVKQKKATLENLSGPIGAVRKFFAKQSEAELSAELGKMAEDNGKALQQYSTALSKAFPASFGITETAHSGGLDGITRGSHTGVSSPSGGYSGGGGGYTGAGYASSFGAGAYSSRTPSRFNRGQRPRIPGVSEADLIDINKYLSQFASPSTGTVGSTRGTGFELSDYARNSPNPYEKYSSNPNTGLSFYKPSPSYGGFDGGFNRSTYAPFSPSPSFGSSGSGLGSSLGGFAPGGSGTFSSDSRMAGTRLSNASARTPHIGLPGGLGGVSRFAGAGSMNPGAFRGTGVGGANALTGGLGMGAATSTASPATGFGGVQTTPASQTAARPMMPGMMSPMAGAGASAGKGNRQGNREGIQSNDTNILADINAFGTQRVEDVEESESAQTGNSAFTPSR